MVDLTALSAWRHEDQRSVVGSPVFAGTALEGTEVDGLAAEVLPFLSILRPRSPFYDTVADNLERAIGDVPSLRRTDDEVVLVLAEDFEDVNGMARQVGLTADLVDANMLAITGDLTFAGLRVETYIIDTVDYYSGKRPVYFTPGLHDTPAVLAAAEARDWQVADGEVTEIDGLTLLPLADPRISTVGSFGAGSVLRDPEVDIDRMVDDAIDEACAERPDLVLLHDHLLGRRIAEAGCQEVAVLDGRSFQFVGPQEVTTSGGTDAIQFTGGSSGGHTDTRPNPGRIRNPARFAVLTVRPDTSEATYALVTVSPDASVTVTPEIDLRVPYEQYVSSGFTGLSLDVARASTGPTLARSPPELVATGSHRHEAAIRWAQDRHTARRFCMPWRGPSQIQPRRPTRTADARDPHARKPWSGSTTSPSRARSTRSSSATAPRWTRVPTRWLSTCHACRNCPSPPSPRCCGSDGARRPEESRSCYATPRRASLTGCNARACSAYWRSSHLPRLGPSTGPT